MVNLEGHGDIDTELVDKLKAIKVAGTLVHITNIAGHNRLAYVVRRLMPFLDSDEFAMTALDLKNKKEGVTITLQKKEPDATRPLVMHAPKFPSPFVLLQQDYVDPAYVVYDLLKRMKKNKTAYLSLQHPSTILNGLIALHKMQHELCLPHFTVEKPEFVLVKSTLIQKSFLHINFLCKST